MNRWIIVFLLTLTLGGAWLWVSRVPVDATVVAREPQPAVGYSAPDFALDTLDGQAFVLSEAIGSPEGMPVVLNFWATWCGPCKREMPALQQAAQRYDGDVLIVGVDQGEPAATVQQFVDELGLTFDIPMDTDGAVGSRYNVRGLPTTYFIDGDGVIQEIWSGEMNAITLAEKIESIR
jgi:cytochrome c biogenesis protein CcmG/thiol:disulfide interchange protein DsbE